jgi:hypothetical protein
LIGSTLLRSRDSIRIMWLVFVAGGLLELGGLYLVGRDVLDAHIKNATPLTPAEVKKSLGGKMWNKYTAAVATNAAAGGNIRRRAWGVGLFAAGIIVQTVGNILAL